MRPAPRSPRTLPLRPARPALAEPLEGRVLLAFGLTTTATSYVVDTGADVKFTILRGGTISSTIHLGDLTSVTYKGSEMLAPYSATSRYSHYEQGLSSVTAVTAATDAAGNWIKITCDDSNTAAGGSGIIHYYLAKKGENNVYMASLPSDVNASPGEGRFIAYLSRGVFTNLGLEEPSNISANVGAVEGSDVFYESSGVTKSKFYNTRRMIENAYHGVTGTGVGAWMFMGNREHGAGGPFFRDIDFQTTADATELYNCLFTGHTQTEAYRQGLLGPYAMQFTDGSLPLTPDYSWMEGAGIQGWIPVAQRGALAGTASGVPAGHEVTVGLSNSAAQYWATPDPTTGQYTIGGIQAGTYTETLYDNELAVGTRTVTIAAGQTARADIVDTYYTPPAIFRIGTWDGTPKEFLNADRINTMHPQDPRMSDWVLPTFTVGSTPDAAWPLAQFKDINNSRRIVFTLTAAQVQALTLRVGLTLAFAGGRPNIIVNAGQSYAWTSTFQNPSTQPDSRGITRGTWRGNNVVHSFNIPAANLRAGVNTIDVSVISGQTSTGFLSPSVTYDAIDLVTTASLTNTPRVGSIAIAPAGPSVGTGGLATFAATAYDQGGNVIPANIDWSASRGAIDDAGLYAAPATTGGDTITATVGAVAASTTVNVLGTPPIVVTPARAAANPVFNNATALSVLGADDGGEATLTYTWSVAGTPPAPVTFSVNGTNGAKNTVANFSKAGDYNLLVTIRDGSGATASSPVSVSVRDAVAWYKADATDGGALADASGSGNAAKLYGTYGSYSLTPGVVRAGSALKLAGGSAGGYASLPAGIVSGLNDFTISAWVKPDAANNWARIFDFGSTALTSGGNGPKNYMFLTARTGTTGNVLRFAISTNGIMGEQVINGPALATGVWTHVALTLAGNTATLYVNGQAYATNTNMTLRPSSLGITTNNFIGKSQFADPLFQGSIDDFRIYGKALSAADVQALADVVAPQVVTGQFAFESAQSVVFTFSEDVTASVDPTDLSIFNLSTRLPVPASEFTLTKQGGPGAPTTATWTHTGALPDGNYRVTLPAGSVADSAGNPLAADYTFDFFVLAGDANRDRTVNFDDLLVLAKNYNKMGATYSQGDLNYDGVVNFDDLLILAKAYNQTLAAPAAAPVAMSASFPALTAPVQSVLKDEASTVFSTRRVAPPPPPAPLRPTPKARRPATR
jgi:rhamnogalacturonan endolyase